MMTYPEKVAQSSKLFDNLPLDRTIVTSLFLFLTLICFGIIRYGQTNSSSIFFIALTSYAVLLGFFVARIAYKRKLANMDDYSYLKILATRQTATELLIDSETQAILYNNKTGFVREDEESATLSQYLDDMGLHTLDKSKILNFFQGDIFMPFVYVFEKKSLSSPSQWFSFETQAIEKSNKTLVLFRIHDITKEQENIQTQQQYICDMEQIIQNQYRPTNSLQLISQMAQARDIYRPVQTIRSYVRLIENHYKQQLDEKGQGYWDKLVQESYQLDTLMTDLYTMTNLEADHMLVKKVDLNELMEAVLLKLDHPITQSLAKINYPKLPTIKADQNQLLLLFHNLIENALMYSGSQPPVVHISCYQNESHWVFRVSDQGMGLDAKTKSEIFQHLNRGQITKGIRGLGLGLSICKQVVDNHQGDIWVESEGLGKGSTFAFSIPLQQIEVLDYQAVRQRQPMAV